MCPENCVFCDISNGDKSNFVLESDHSFSVFDIHPNSKGHSLVITKKHFQDYSSTDDESLMDAALLAKKVAKFLKNKYPEIKGFRYISNQGKEGKQVIFHLHIHIIPVY